MLYTRKGDKGVSGLFGTKERFPKNSPIYEALGTVDELNSLLGMCRARSNKVKKVKDGSDIGRALLHVQKCLFVIQAELAGAQKSIVQSNVDDIEKIIERFENRIPNLGTFVIPGATELSALYDYARSVSRRTERMVINAQPLRIVSPATLAYLNRLSSFLYILARHVACADDVIELSPSY